METLKNIAAYFTVGLVAGLATAFVLACIVGFFVLLVTEPAFLLFFSVLLVFASLIVFFIWSFDRVFAGKK